MQEWGQKEIARILSLTTRQIRNLENEGMPCRAEKNRKFYGPDAVRWYYERDVQRRVEQLAPTDFNDAKAREMAARAEKAELEVRGLRAETIDMDDLETLHAKPLAHLRSFMMALPGRIAAELPMPAVEAVEIIEPIVHEVMREMSEFDPDEDDE